MLYQYCYKRNLDGAYEKPWFELAEPEDMKRDLNYFVIANVDKAAENHLNIMTLCLVGTFDQSTGKSDLKEVPEPLLDLSIPFNQMISLRGNNNG